MQEHSIDAIEANPNYRELVCARRCFAWNLTVLMLVIYYGFILAIAFAPQLLGAPLSAGAATTLGIPVGILIILSAFALTGLYVVRANGRFDRLTQAIRDEVNA